MKSCPKCLNLSPATAVACEQCGTVLDDSVIARAEAASGGQGTTLLEAPERPRPSPPPLPSFRPSPPPPPPGSGSPSIPVTPPGAVNTPGRRGQTVYMPPSATYTGGATPVPPAPRTSGRKVIAVLVTYSWKPEGQVFPVCEGRNLIGRGEECEIRVPDDPMMSQVNSHITFRQNFVLGDMVSMSGTDLNGEPVEEQFRPMANYAQIRTGSTVWTFVVIDPLLAGRRA